MWESCPARRRVFLERGRAGHNIAMINVQLWDRGIAHTRSQSDLVVEGQRLRATLALLDDHRHDLVIPRRVHEVVYRDVDGIR